MRKFLIIAIPIVALFFFVLIMLSNTFLKGPLEQDDNLSQTMETIMEDVKNENWKEASKEIDKLEHVWDKVVKRIQISSEKDEIDFFNSNIARLRGAIMAKDKSDALIELTEAYSHWNKMSN